MAATPTTKWQVGGYRFLVRRMEHALVRRDVRMLHDPMRSQSRALAVGLVIACIGLAGCAALALLRPQDKIGDSAIVVGKESGAMFVRVDETFHPVLNLASARLVVGQADDPTIVKDSELANRPRGALVGIPGAPSSLPYDVDGTSVAWSVCDTVGGAGSVAGTTVIAGDPRRGDGIEQLQDTQAFLWETGDGVFLVYDGVRAAIDLNDRSVVRALGLENTMPSGVSEALANTVPVVPPIAPPLIPRAGELPAYSLAGKTVGSVVKVVDTEDRYYVVLSEGIQEVSVATAQLITFADSQGSPEIDSLTPDALSDAPSADSLAVKTFPRSRPSIVDRESEPVGCVAWLPQDAPDGGPTARLEFSSGRVLPLPDSARPVALAQADGGGPAADEVFVQPGSGGFVQTTGISPTSVRRDGYFFVADTGVRYGVADADAAKALGFGAAASAPWQIVELLGVGPALSRDAALTAHDGVGPDPDAALLPSE
ncbi:type VII secretion protein EccB [Rhodococcus sp. 14-2470-1b]|uniref:type VII secretion protein EccB n=1 Tax=Rhodococcus sp. 14-2470-1b TaxID=2023149 RepID=UPI000B9A700B|nr:type VII secretion protein EccB [Rhodococcus sp. 14-2470-1b]OZF58147.1 type VII secretion protein EccB [Rhodococcus sp. 14-2470-1b]